VVPIKVAYALTSPSGLANLKKKIIFLLLLKKVLCLPKEAKEKISKNK
jgi:hypothetical protein